MVKNSAGIGRDYGCLYGVLGWVIIVLMIFFLTLYFGSK
jgi:tetrahydromethanopterin S-methyltransferase subunit G